MTPPSTEFVGYSGDSPVQALHRAYCEITGFEIGLDYMRATAWSEFIRRGWGVDEIKLVVFEIRRGITERSRKPGALKFRNLIGDPDWFEEDLAEARANMRSRKPPMTEKDKLLKQTGRATETTSTARTVGTVIKAITPQGQAAAEAFARLKETI